MKKRLVSVISALVLGMTAIGFSACSFNSKVESTTWVSSYDVTSDFAEANKVTVEDLNLIGIESCVEVVTIKLFNDKSGIIKIEDNFKFNAGAAKEIKNEFEPIVTQTAVMWNGDKENKVINITATYKDGKDTLSFNKENDDTMKGLFLGEVRTFTKVK